MLKGIMGDLVLIIVRELHLKKIVCIPIPMKHIGAVL